MQGTKKSYAELNKRIIELEQLVSKQENEKKQPDSIDISNFSFSDLVDISDLQQLLDNLYGLVGCPIAVLDTNNNFLASAGLQKICTCFHRIHPETNNHCSESDCFIQENLKTKNPIAYKCKNGLWDVAYPIFIEKKHVASIFLGQFFFDDEVIDIPYFERQAKKYGFNKTEYLNALHEVPIISRKKADSLKHYNAALAQILTKAGYSNLLLKKEKIEELRIANEQIKESELKFRTVFEQAGVGVVQAEASTRRFIKINKKFADMLGYSIDELLQMTFLDITHPDDLEKNLHQMNLLNKKTNNEFSLEKRYIRKDGTILWAIVTVNGMNEVGGQMTNIGIAQDITERKKSEQALLESEIKLRKLFEQAGVGVAQVESSTNQFIRINKKFAEIVGYTVAEMMQLTFRDFTHPDDIEESLHYKENINNKKNKDLSTEKRYVRKDGTIVWIKLTTSAMWEVEEGCRYHISIVQDITESKQSAQDLKESEFKFRKLFELAGVGVAQVDISTGRFVKVNKKLADMFGYSFDELLSLTFKQVTHPDDLIGSLQNQNRLLQKQIGDFSIEKRYVRKDGSTVWAILTASSMGEIDGGEQFQIAVVQDVTERKKTENDIKESEEKFKSIFYQSPIALHLYDANGKLVDCNPACLSLFGIDNLSEVLGFNLFEAPNLSEQQKRDIKNGKNVQFESQLDFDLVKKLKLYNTKNSGTFFINCIASPFKIQEEKKMGVLLQMQDITERKKMEQSLIEEHERFQATLNAIDSVIYVADMENYEILFVNKFTKDLFGDMSGKKCYSALQGKTTPCDFCTNHLLLDCNGNANKPHIWEFQNSVTKNWYQCHDQAIQWTNGNLVRFEIATDISKNIENEQTLKKTEIKLREINSTKDKLFSIIGHDLKNPFAVLKSSSELLSRYLDKNEIAKSKAKAEMITRASKQGYALLENLLAWAKSQSGGMKFEPQKTNLKNHVAQIITELEAIASEKNIIVTNQIPDDLILEADEHLLSVVFRNLINNAVKFTHNGGAITINAKTDNNIVEIAVIDTGIGIPKEHQYKLFRLDAEFSREGTAHEPSTSLGLVLCKEFIEKHKGKIWVKSDTGKGCEFRFTLPH